MYTFSFYTEMKAEMNKEGKLESSEISRNIATCFFEFLR
jgi:hypothetical protein